ncbi:hypothetical protein BDF19DRAFT_213013 [Syncephalis fuscata]|nr:hypothetical protein BDF19DRAFT_213013 [Syncephalis fuscata]
MKFSTAIIAAPLFWLPLSLLRLHQVSPSHPPLDHHVLSVLVRQLVLSSVKIMVTVLADSDTATSWLLCTNTIVVY